MPYQFTAFLNDPDAPRPENPIHSTQSAREHGFRGALVGGIHVYGWTTGAFLETLGHSWLNDGWVEVSFKKPTYDGDVMTVGMDRGAFMVTNEDADVCLEGKVGPGRAPWFDDITATRWRPGKPPVESPPKLTLASAPVGRALPPMTVPLTAQEHDTFVETTLADDSPLYRGGEAHCHPAWLAGRLIYLLHHSFEYGPAVHTASHIQHLAPAFVGQTFTITGHCRDAFEKRGHHFIINDGSVWAEDRTELVRLRHTAIFRLRARESLTK